MVYPALSNQRKRDEAASTMRRWRKLRDDQKREAALHDSATDPFMTHRNLLWAGERYFAGKAAGYKQALQDLFGDR